MAELRAPVALRTRLRALSAVLIGLTVVLGIGVTSAGAAPGANQPGIDWTLQSGGTGNMWASIAYGDGRFVAVGQAAGVANQLMTSVDGVTWTQPTSPSDSVWNSVAYGNGLFVAVAMTGSKQVMTSPDGLTWTARTSANNNYWVDVAYGNGLFVAVAMTGYGNRVMTSPDGITWTARASASNNDWTNVTFGNGLFVALAISGTGDRVMTSSNGITWTTRTGAPDFGWNSVAYGGGQFVAVAGSGGSAVPTQTSNLIMTSPDGITWTRGSGLPGQSWIAVTYGNGLWVAVGSGGRLMTSPDGVTWTTRTSPVNNTWSAVIYGNGLFVAVAYAEGTAGVTSRVMTSGSILPTQTVTWSPTTALSMPAGSSTFTAATSSGDGAITYSLVSSGTSGCSVNSGTRTVSYTAVGTCTLRASAAATSSYAAGSTDVAFAVSLPTQTVTWSPTTALSMPAGSSVFVAASTSGNGAISYSLVSAGTSGCTLDSGTRTVSYTAAGTCTLRASAAATSSYAAGSTDVAFTVSLASQAVTWTPATALSMPAGSSVFLPATTSGNGAISYSLVSADTTGCTVDDTTMTVAYTATGTCTLRATAAATATYAASTSDVAFTVSRATPTLSWSPSTSVTVPAGSEVFAAATTSSDAPVTYAVTSAGTTGCTVNSATLTLAFTASGSCQVTATVAQTGAYDHASSVATFAIARAAQVVSWSPVTTLPASALTSTLSIATTTGDGAITYSATSSSGEGCAFADPSVPTLTFVAAGTCTVIATAATTAGYAQGTQSAIISLALTTPTVTWSPATGLSMPSGSTVFAPATSSGDGVISYSLVNAGTTGCTVDSASRQVSYTAPGTCILRATASATATYAIATTDVTFTISAAPTPSPPAPGPGPGPSPNPTPTPSPTPTPPRPGPAMEPVPVPSDLPPGSTSLIVDSIAESVRMMPTVTEDGLVAQGTGWSMTLTALNYEGQPIPLGPADSLTLDVGRELHAAGTNFLPTSPMTVYVDPPLQDDTASLARTRLVGAALTDGDGNFGVTLGLPQDLAPGTHVLQVVGMGPQRQVRALSIGITVQPWFRMIKGARLKSTHHDRLWATGISGGLPEGARLTVRVRYGREDNYRYGTAIVVVGADGGFRWSRLITGRKSISAYMSHRDVRSNTVEWVPIPRGQQSTTMATIPPWASGSPS